MTGNFGIVSQRASNLDKANAFSTRLDYNLNNSGDLVTGRYSLQKAEENSALTFVGSNLAGYGGSAIGKPQNMSLGWTRILSSRMVNEGL